MSLSKGRKRSHPSFPSTTIDRSLLMYALTLILSSKYKVSALSFKLKVPCVVFGPCRWREALICYRRLSPWQKRHLARTWGRSSNRTNRHAQRAMLLRRFLTSGRLYRKQAYGESSQQFRPVGNLGLFFEVSALPWEHDIRWTIYRITFLMRCVQRTPRGSRLSQGLFSFPRVSYFDRMQPWIADITTQLKQQICCRARIFWCLHAFA